jgi:hypothetical protein
MERIARIAALLTVPVVGAALLLVLIQLSGTIQRIDHGLAGTFKAVNDTVSGMRSDAQPALTKAGDALDAAKTAISAATPVLQASAAAINRTSDTLNRPCLPAPCGTLPDVNRTLATFRGTAGTLEAAGAHWDRNLGTLDTQELSLYTDFHATAGKLNAGLDSGNAAVQHLDALLSSADVKDLAANVNKGVVTADQMLVLSKDTEEKLTACIRHPTIRCSLRSDAIFAAQLGGYLLH